MAIARWSPTRELSSLQSTMDRLFGELFEDRQEGGIGMPSFRLPVDITETDDRYVIKAPVPGFEPGEVDVSVSDRVLSIKATHREEHKQKEGDYVRREVAFGNYMRQIALPADVRGEDVKATVENGVLTIEVPRAQRPRPQRVEVKHKNGKAQPATSKS